MRHRSNRPDGNALWERSGRALTVEMLLVVGQGSIKPPSEAGYVYKGRGREDAILFYVMGHSGLDALCFKPFTRVTKGEKVDECWRSGWRKVCKYTHEEQWLKG